MTTHPLPAASATEARARILRLLHDRSVQLAGVLALTVGSVATTAVTPALIGRIIDVASRTTRDRQEIDRTVVALAALTLVGAGLRYLAANRAAALGESALDELRVEVLGHSIDASADQFQTISHGDLVNRVTNDVGVLARTVQWSVPTSLFAAVTALVTLGALAIVDWRIGLAAAAAGAPVAAAGGRWYFREAPSRYLAERVAQGALASGLLEAYRGRHTLTSYRAGPRHRRAIVEHGRHSVHTELATTSARNRLRPAVSVSLGLSLAAALAAGAVLVDHGETSVGTVTAAMLYVMRLFDPVGTLLENADDLQQATAAVARLLGVMQLERPRRRDIEYEQTSGSAVELRGVSFAFNDGPLVIDEIDLQIPAGERVAVVGPSGAGKTTLARLLCGVLAPSTGKVCIGGVDLSRIGAPERSRLVALVTQEPHVFNRSIADNLRLARPDATAAALASALEAVGADRWVERLPGGLDAVVELDSANEQQRLTRAQAQELALARVVALDPAIVVVDEPTAALDPASAATSEHRLAAALTGRTVITIAHRLDSAHAADRVIVIDGGRIVEQGNHDELALGGGTYAALWHRWSTSRGMT